MAPRGHDADNLPKRPIVDARYRACAEGAARWSNRVD